MMPNDKKGTKALLKGDGHSPPVALSKIAWGETVNHRTTPK